MSGGIVMAEWLKGNLSRADRASDSLAKGFQAKFAGGESLKDSIFKIGDYGQNALTRQLQRDMPGITGKAEVAKQTELDALKAQKMGMDDPLGGESAFKKEPTFIEQILNQFNQPKTTGAEEPAEKRPAKDILTEAGTVPPEAVPSPRKEIDVQEAYLNYPEPYTGEKASGTETDATGKYARRAAMSIGAKDDATGYAFTKVDYVAPDGTVIKGEEWYKKANQHGADPEKPLPEGWKVRSKDYKPAQDFLRITGEAAKGSEESPVEQFKGIASRGATEATKTNPWAGYSKEEALLEDKFNNVYDNLKRKHPKWSENTLFDQTMKAVHGHDYRQGGADTDDKNDVQTMINYVMEMKLVAARELPNLWNKDGTPIKGFEEEAYKEAARIMTKMFPSGFKLDSFDRGDWNKWLETIDPTDESTWEEPLKYFESLIKNPYTLGKEVAKGGDMGRGIAESIPLLTLPGLLYTAGANLVDSLTGKKITSEKEFEEYASVPGRRFTLNSQGIFTYQNMLAKAKEEINKKTPISSPEPNKLLPLPKDNPFSRIGQ